jgi:hypothetical protein
MNHGQCKDCRHWRHTGQEDSGILLPAPSTENWFYDVGMCEAPPELGNGSGWQQASWTGCYSFKARRGVAQQ